MIFLDLTSKVKVFIWSFMSRRRIYIYIPLYFISILFKFFFLNLYINIFSFMSFSNFNNCSSELPIIFHQVNITLTISFLSPFLTLSLLQILLVFVFDVVVVVVIFKDKESSGGVHGM